ncbi:MAG: hypothetical protein J6T10_04355 [Methanobrevibacter sp.]|nr:hypothetical protein [Methanobrevibacter sp.]
MNLPMNNKSVTTNELVRTVICSVLEDVDLNFEDYAKLYVKDYNDYTENEKLSIEQWKFKIFSKLNSVLKKEGLLEND